MLDRYHFIVIIYRLQNRVGIRDQEITGRNSVKEVRNMKKDIHPKYQKAVVTCACGNTFETKSVVSDINVDICSNCHPFYTGKQKLVDSGGRVDKFNKRMQNVQSK